MKRKRTYESIDDLNKNLGADNEGTSSSADFDPTAELDQTRHYTSEELDAYILAHLDTKNRRRRPLEDENLPASCHAIIDDDSLLAEVYPTREDISILERNGYTPAIQNGKTAMPVRIYRRQFTLQLQSPTILQATVTFIPPDKREQADGKKYSITLSIFKKNEGRGKSSVIMLARSFSDTPAASTEDEIRKLASTFNRAADDASTTHTRNTTT